MTRGFWETGSGISDTTGCDGESEFIFLAMSTLSVRHENSNPTLSPKSPTLKLEMRNGLPDM